jgi:hypothetical protein
MTYNTPQSARVILGVAQQVLGEFQFQIAMIYHRMKELCNLKKVPSMAQVFEMYSSSTPPAGLRLGRVNIGGAFF